MGRHNNTHANDSFIPVVRVTRLTHDHTRWELAPDFAPLLPLLLATPARVVKESAAKLVTEHSLDGRGYFIKRYRHFAVPFRSWKYWFKASQAHEEWQLAQTLAQRQVPVVRHVGLGERRDWRGVLESILITEAFAGVPANEVHNPALDSLVAFIDQVWRAGVFQSDLHPANLLVARDSSEMRLVDLHGILLRDTPVEADRDAMLAVMRMSLPIPVPPRVESLSLVQRRQLLHKRSARCLRTNRDFAVRRFGELQWNVRRAALTPAVEKILGAPDSFIDRAVTLKRGRSSTVAVAQGLVLKRYNFKKPLNLLKDLFRGSRGRRGFRKAHHLGLCGLATPSVVATADHCVGGFPVRSYVLMAEVPHAIDAGQWTGAPREAARQLGSLLAQLHDEGFTHRDLKETNILFDAEGRPHLIDLDGLEFVFEVSTEGAAANLHRLAEGLSAAGQMNRITLRCFLHSYCRQRRLRPRVLFPRPRRRA